MLHFLQLPYYTLAVLDHSEIYVSNIHRFCRRADVTWLSDERVWRTTFAAYQEIIKALETVPGVNLKMEELHELPLKIITVGTSHLKSPFLAVVSCVHSCLRSVFADRQFSHGCSDAKIGMWIEIGSKLCPDVPPICTQASVTLKLFCSRDGMTTLKGIKVGECLHHHHIHIYMLRMNIHTILWNAQVCDVLDWCNCTMKRQSPAQ